MRRGRPLVPLSPDTVMFTSLHFLLEGKAPTLEKFGDSFGSALRRSCAPRSIAAAALVRARHRLDAQLDVVHLYVIRSKWRDQLQKFLIKKEISTDIHYPIPDHMQPAMNCMLQNTDLKNTEQLAKQVLTLPCFPELTTAEVDKIVYEINRWKPT